MWLGRSSLRIHTFWDQKDMDRFHSPRTSLCLFTCICTSLYTAWIMENWCTGQEDKLHSTSFFHGQATVASIGRRYALGLNYWVDGWENVFAECHAQFGMQFHLSEQGNVPVEVMQRLKNSQSIQNGAVCKITWRAPKRTVTDDCGPLFMSMMITLSWSLDG